MLDDTAKADLGKRLRRAEGQVKAVSRMIEEDAYCIDVLTQIAAATAAIEKVGNIVLRQHLETCVAASFAEGDADDRRQKIDELTKIFGKYSNFG